MAFCDGTFLPPMPVAEGHNQSYSCETPGGVAMSSIASSLPGRMNVFQKLMYQWSELHPYNAVHIYRIAAMLDQRRLLASIAHAYRHNGLGRWKSRPTANPIWHCRAATPELEVVEGGDDPHQRMLAQVGAGLTGPSPRPLSALAVFGSQRRPEELLPAIDLRPLDCRQRGGAAGGAAGVTPLIPASANAARAVRSISIRPPTGRCFCAAARGRCGWPPRRPAPAVQRDPQSGSAAGCLLVGHADGGQFRAVRHRARHGGPIARYSPGRPGPR